MRNHTILKYAVLLSGFGFFLLLAGTVSRVSADDWNKIGSAHASHKAETDKLDINSKTAYRQIRFKVEVETIIFKSVRIVFEDGGEQQVEIGPIITSGNYSREIDLRGGPHRIKKIYVEYGSRPDLVPLNMKQGKLIVYARQ